MLDPLHFLYTLEGRCYMDCRTSDAFFAELVSISFEQFAYLGDLVSSFFLYMLGILLILIFELVFYLIRRQQILVQLKRQDHDGQEIKSCSLQFNYDSKKIKSVGDVLSFASQRVNPGSWTINTDHIDSIEAKFYNTTFHTYVNVSFQDAFQVSEKGYIFIYHEKALNQPSNSTSRHINTDEISKHTAFLNSIDEKLARIPNADQVQNIFDTLSQKVFNLSEQIDRKIEELKSLMKNMEGKFLEETSHILKKLEAQKSETNLKSYSNNSSTVLNSSNFNFGDSKIEAINHDNPLTYLHKISSDNKLILANSNHDHDTKPFSSSVLPLTALPSHNHTTRSNLDMRATTRSIKDNEKSFNTNNDNSINIPVASIKSITRCSLLSEDKNIAIGQSYDLLNGRIIESSIFDQVFPESYSVEQTNVIEPSIIYQNDVELAFKALKIEPDLQVNILAQLNAAPEYVKTLLASHSTNRTYVSVVLRCTKKKTRLANQNRVILSNKTTNASHFVIGIDYGHTAVLTIEHPNADANDTNINVTQQDLKAFADLVVNSIKNNSNIPENLAEIPIKSFFVDFHPKDFSPPKTLKQASDLFKKIVNVSDCFGGPFRYQLVPILDVIKNTNLTPVREINYNLSSVFIREYTNLRNEKEFLNDKLLAMDDFIIFMDSDVVQQINRQRKEFQQEEESKMQNLKNQIEQYRQCRIKESELDLSIKSAFNDLHEKIDDLGNFIDQQSSQKIEFIQDLRGNGVKCLGKDMDLSEDLRTSDLSHVFYGSAKEIVQNPRSIDAKNGRLFKRIVVQEKHTRKFFVDLDTWKNRKHDQKSQISLFNREHLQIEDILNSTQNENNRPCLLRSTETMIIEAMPSYMATLNLVCPSCIDGFCSSKIQNWLCEKCMRYVQYGNDQRFHCDCGSASIFSYEFQCSDWEHGETFTKFHDLHLFKEKLRPLLLKDEMNILLYGESGVGKSTFINGLTNYFKYSSFEEAKNGEPTYIIPSVFTLKPLGNLEGYKIRIGEPDANEVRLAATGYSVTQYPTAYVFQIGHKIIRIIDTPGVNDTRGEDQDRLNFEQILNYIANYEKIDAVCILLKPDMARLTVNARNCLALLNNLQKSALANVLFCFTHASSVMFSNSDSYATLRAYFATNSTFNIMLDKQNTFYVDSDAYRYLWAKHHKVNLETFKENLLKYSWDKSREHMMRLLEHVTSLKPQSLEEMISVSQVRNHIYLVTQPIVDVLSNLQRNIDLISKSLLKLNNYAFDKGNFTDLRSIIEEVPFHKPRVVCLKCSKLGKFESIEIRTSFYNKICMDPCYLNKIVAENPVEKFKKCSLFTNSNTCQKCQCPISEHVRICYENRINIIKNSEFHSTNLMTMDEKQQIIQRLGEDSHALKKEKSEILSSLVKFYSFMQNHQTMKIPFDYFEVQLHNLIYAEHKLGNISHAQSLNETLKEYVNQRGAEKMETHVELLTPQYIDQLKEKLFGLKSSGQKLKELYDIVLLCENAGQYQSEKHYQENFAISSAV